MRLDVLSIMEDSYNAIQAHVPRIVQFSYLGTKFIGPKILSVPKLQNVVASDRKYLWAHSEQMLC